MVELLAKETGYSSNIVRNILDKQGDLIAKCMVNQEDVHFPRVLKIRAETQTFQWGDTEGERIVLRIRPMKPLRQELNKWTSSES
jgi:hypothetical protein